MRKNRYSKTTTQPCTAVRLEKESHYDDKIEIKRDYCGWLVIVTRGTDDPDGRMNVPE
jgi:hypothetical protein